MGLKEGGARGSLRNISTGVGTIPDSVVYQWRAEEFASPWPANVGGVDMTVNGLTSTTFGNGSDAVNGDGTDDRGDAAGPESLLQQETFGLAFTIRFGSLTEFSGLFGVTEGDARITHFTGLSGQLGDIQPSYKDNNGNELSVYTNNAYDDGTVHPVVINKTSNSASGVSIWVDDMAAAAPTTITSDGAFDHTNVSLTDSMSFWSRKLDGSPLRYVPADFGVFEFSNSPYSQTERKDFVSRRPEV
jgi:hypothetical protein